MALQGIELRYFNYFLNIIIIRYPIYQVPTIFEESEELFIGE